MKRRGLPAPKIRRATSSAYQSFQATYRYNPVGFVHDCLVWRPGQHPAFYQDEILADFARYKRMAVRGPHGLGKTALASWVILWFGLTRDGEDWKVVSTASAYRQLEKFLWPEVHKWMRRINWEKVGRAPFNDRTESMTMSLRLASGEAFAVASDNSDLIEGAHADNLLYLFDEAKIIPPDTWDSAEGAFSNAGDDTPAEAYALAVSTPGEPGGRFYDIHSRMPGYEDWHTRHVTLADAIKAGRVSQSWATQRGVQWGETSAVYQNRVLGEFAASEADGVIPLAWIELANERWAAWVEAGKPGVFKGVGVDVARSGEDKTSMALRFDNAIDNLRRSAREDTMATVGRVKGILDAQRMGQAVVDVIGVGAGVVDRLREQSYAVIPFNAGESTKRKDRSAELEFLNVRAAAWWNLREMLDPSSGEDIALPPDDLLTGDLTAPHWRIGSAGKIQIESKDDIKKRLGRSTDDGDAVVMVFDRLTSAQSWLDALDAATPTRAPNPFDQPYRPRR